MWALCDNGDMPPPANWSDQEKSSGDNEQDTSAWKGAQRDGDNNGQFRVFIWNYL